MSRHCPTGTHLILAEQCNATSYPVLTSVHKDSSRSRLPPPYITLDQMLLFMVFLFLFFYVQKKRVGFCLKFKMKIRRGKEIINRT